MATKLGRKTLPAGHAAEDFKYVGRPARDQGDFGRDVGLADMACVNQFGEANNAKYYHGGVCKSAKTGAFYVYLEWGRMKADKSWNGSFGGGDFMFVECSSEDDARSFFATQMASKNTKRLESKNIGGKTIWASREGDDGYLVQKLATRAKGLPDAYLIKDDSGIAAAKPAAVAPKAEDKKAAKAPSKSFHPHVVSFARALVGGVQSFTRSMAAASGVTPTADAIREVRDDLIPLALQRIKKVGNDIDDQVKDSDLRDISKMVSALVPRPIPRTGMSDAEAILSAGNILALQQDLDAFEAALRNEDFSAETTTDKGTDPDALLNASLTWLDPNSKEGQWVARAFASMTNHKHGYIRGNLRVKHVFSVVRTDRDVKFMAAVAAVAAKRGGNCRLKANLQPGREDLGSEADLYRKANVALTIHGTRPVNIAPIIGTNFRLPKSLPGAQITGANFGHGVYFATDWKKSYGYTGRGAWGHGGGEVHGRGCMMFLCDMIMGDAYRAPSTGSWNTPPNGCDSVFGVGGDRGHQLENDEHVIFSPDYQRIRYVVEFDWMT